ncbi:MAG: exodeoxyribonuclease VII large subunit [Woeseiaceae bacterium]|nr:exodeoxyribonuclease VII large subunit [Woeseiaceae bacterium]
MAELPEKSPAELAIPVSELNRKVKALLERGIARLWVEGEISNIARPASGHLYFSLKDDSAQIRAAFFRQRQRGPTIGLKDGDQVLAFGRVSLYEPRGDYQLIVEQIEPAGEGALKREFDKLKRKLQAEGLFDTSRKRQLPLLPRRVGVITSPSGAAIRDILTVMRRRFPSVPVVIYPSAVQGDAAPGELIEALEAAIRRAECDVLIIGRGGGSLEDLWAFNDEKLARSIADCPIPVVSAVGHEVDFTIADFVADVRAPTPSGAAELVVPNREDWLRTVNRLAQRIAQLGERAVDDHAQTLDFLARRLSTTMQRQLLYYRQQVQYIRQTLVQQSPAMRVQRSMAQLTSLQQRLAVAGRSNVSNLGHRLQLAARALHSVSPLATLDRGYAIVMDAESGAVLSDVEQVAKGSTIRARLYKGELTATVTGKKK